MKGKVLGRGLGNLIPTNEKKEEITKETHPGLLEVKIVEIKPNPHQPRKSFSSDSIAELAETIKLHGIIQPIVVKKISSGYELISGERRLRACKEAGFSKIPVIVKDVSENTSMEMALLENIQREDLNAIDEGLAYQKIMDSLGIKVSELATRVGKNRSTVANLIRLTTLPDKTKDLIRSGKLSEGQSRPLLSIADGRKIDEIAVKIANEGWTARQVEDFVSELTEGKSTKSSSPSKKNSKDPSVVKVETKLRNKLSARVEIVHNEKNGKGKLQIFYSNLEEMERILKNLGV